MITIQHITDDRYINKDRDDGFCTNVANATKFKSVFQAMKFLAIQGEEDIVQYEFLDDVTDKCVCRRR